jgi:hypothetical protein
MSAHMPDSKTATVTEDDIQAAIAEIENMSAAEVAAIPGTSDGHGDAPGPREQRSPTEPDRTTAGAAAERTVAAQRPARVDRAASGRADSQDEPADAAGGVAQRVGAWVHGFRSSLSWPLARLRRLLGREPADTDTPPQEAPPSPTTTEEEQSDLAADVLPDSGFWRLVDQALDKLNQPFARFSSRVRSAIGLAAIVTVVISLATLLLSPHVLPQRDALSFLREKRAQLDARPTVPAPPESLTAGNDSPGP